MKGLLKFISCLIVNGALIFVSTAIAGTNAIPLGIFLFIFTTSILLYLRWDHINRTNKDVTVDDHIQQLVVAENATRRGVAEIISKLREYGSKLKTHDDTISRLRTELSRHRDNQHKLVGRGNKSTKKSAQSGPGQGVRADVEIDKPVPKSSGDKRTTRRTRKTLPDTEDRLGQAAD